MEVDTPYFRLVGESEEDFSLRCKRLAYLWGHITVEEYEQAVERVLRFYAERRR